MSTFYVGFIRIVRFSPIWEESRTFYTRAIGLGSTLEQGVLRVRSFQQNLIFSLIQKTIQCVFLLFSNANVFLLFEPQAFQRLIVHKSACFRTRFCLYTWSVDMQLKLSAKTSYSYTLITRSRISLSLFKCSRIQCLFGKLPGQV